MRRLVYYVGVSLDGYIAGPSGEIDFYALPGDMAAWIGEQYPETIPTHARPLMGVDADEPNRHFDTLIMGRRTYEPALAIGVTSPYTHLKQYVVSTSLGRIDDPMVELVEQDPVGLVRRLKQDDGKDIWLCGGGTLAGALLGEIDELITKTYPVVAGSGVPAVSSRFRPTEFIPRQRQEFSNGTLVTWFTRA